MTKLLDTVDISLQEVEEQLLDEFNRIRNTISDARSEPIDKGTQEALSSVVEELWHMLEHSGDKKELQLQSEEQETLFARASVIKQLLKAKIPTAYLHEIHKDVNSSRRALESRVEEKRESKKEDESLSKKIGFFDSIKSIFSHKKSEQETLRNRITVTDQEAKEFEPVEIYLDNGIYSASRELAMLSNRMFVSHPTESQLEPAEKKVEHPKGKASFESRDLSRSAPPPVQEKNKIAQTPDEIRTKLESKQAKPNAVSTFESKELTQTISTNDPVHPIKEKFTSAAITSERKETDSGQSIAQSPEAIRRKLAARQRPTVTGRATFGSKDIDHAMPAMEKTDSASGPAALPKGKAIFGSKDIDRAMPASKKSVSEPIPEPTPLPKGKAIFESKDLSKPGPIRKK
jgi:hypothetical protein